MFIKVTRHRWCSHQAVHDGRKQLGGQGRVEKSVFGAQVIGEQAEKVGKGGKAMDVHEEGGRKGDSEEASCKEGKDRKRDAAEGQKRDEDGRENELVGKED